MQAAYSQNRCGTSERRVRKRKSISDYWNSPATTDSQAKRGHCGKNCNPLPMQFSIYETCISMARSQDLPTVKVIGRSQYTMLWNLNYFKFLPWQSKKLVEKEESSELRAALEGSDLQAGAGDAQPRSGKHRRETPRGRAAAEPASAEQRHGKGTWPAPRAGTANTHTVPRCTAPAVNSPKVPEA